MIKELTPPSETQAGQATEPESRSPLPSILSHLSLTLLDISAMIPLSLAGKSTNVILAGDPCQLGPVSLVHSHSVSPLLLRLIILTDPSIA